jgi:arginase
MQPICLIRAPCNLGLRPLRPGHEPGTWRAPQALTEAGLVEAIAPAAIVDLERPIYHAEAESGTMLRNGHSLRHFNLELADRVKEAVAANRFPLIIGGDCSVLLGALAGHRRSGPLSLIHVDGHSDFRNPANYDAANVLSAVAGMDLALATGRGDPLMTAWPGVHAPLVLDEQVVQIGEREGRNSDFAWPDVNDTAFNRIDVFEARRLGADAVVASALATVGQKDWPFWLHFDVDVLDQTTMPAVDSPGSPGINPDELKIVLSRLLADPRCAGMDFTIFDPDLDPDGSLAAWLVAFLGEMFAAARCDEFGDNPNFRDQPTRRAP